MSDNMESQIEAGLAIAMAMLGLVAKGLFGFSLYQLVQAVSGAAC